MYFYVETKNECQSKAKNEALKIKIEKIDARNGAHFPQSK